MVEEKKEEVPSPKPAEAVKAEEKKKETAPKIERPSNCAACNKSIKRKRWYYRNGKYYCTKKCWKTAAKKEEKPKGPEAKNNGA